VNYRCPRKNEKCEVDYSGSVENLSHFKTAEMYLGGRGAQTVHPSSKLAYKRHILGMSTSSPPHRSNSCRPNLCRLSCTGEQHPNQTTFPGAVFGGSGLAKPLRRNSEISHGCRPTLRDTDSRLLFQTWSKSVQDKCLKGRVVLVTEKQNKTHFGGVWRNPWGDFP